MKAFHSNASSYTSIVRAARNLFKINTEYHRIVKLLGDPKLS